MKKLLWSIAAAGFLCILVVIAGERASGNAILSISEIEHRRYEEMIVLKRDHTYEQLIKITDTDTDKETIIGHTGTWQPTKVASTGTILPTEKDENNIQFDVEIKTRVKNYILFKKMLRDYGKGGALREIDSWEPPPVCLLPARRC